MRIVLDVDAENTTSPLRLYEGAGMTPRPAFTIWEKRPGLDARDSGSRGPTPGRLDERSSS